MSIQIVFVTVIATSVCVDAITINKGCSILFPKKDDRLQPLLLRNISKWTYDFFIPEGKTLNMEVKEPITFLCPSKGNVIEGVNTNMTSYECNNKELLSKNGNTVPFDSIQCKSIVKGSVITTSRRCGNNMGKIMNIGYQVTRTQFLTLFESCYDSKRVNPIYTNHTIYGQAVPALSRQSFRPPFSEEGTPYNLQFLSRGHLSPDADFIFAPMQFTTYFFVNVNPHWQSINAGNWLKIEAMVRKLAGKLKIPLQIFTGSHDVLSLPDINNNPVEIYLDSDNRIPVPKYLWKVVYNEATQEGIALIAINNPFLKSVSAHDIICPNICDEYYWDSPAFKTIHKGYLFCCNVMELKRVVPTIPNIKIRNVLSA
ncbi:hypothetical protein FQR65_LT13010 [Abscondita terminalis]|nr:hypothetical protein FQR65_LT13010 [Abscondita terminalis]